jgi:hypothetical protein
MCRPNHYGKRKEKKKGKLTSGERQLLPYTVVNLLENRWGNWQ